MDCASFFRELKKNQIRDLHTIKQKRSMVVLNFNFGVLLFCKFISMDKLENKSAQSSTLEHINKIILTLS